MQKSALTGMLPEEISFLLPKNKEKYRGMQIFRWIHERCAESFDEMTNLPASFRREIKNTFSIRSLDKRDVVSSADGSTDKYLWSMWDGQNIESVIIRDHGRVTACISSQVGCKMACIFCRTGEMGFKRNLTPGEIIDQLILMKRSLREKNEDITNIVFMGMGEPLDNLDAVIKAIRIINMEEALEIGQRKITVSTCGITPGINYLAGAFKRIGLAISLNAPDEKLRSSLMPINRKYPLKEIMKAAGNYARITKKRVTFEYILIDGVNDSPAHARKLLALAKRVPSKINLITFNEFEGSPFKRPPDKKVEAFRKIIFEGNITAMLRKSKGLDIYAACGQLAGKNR